MPAEVDRAEELTLFLKQGIAILRDETDIERLVLWRNRAESMRNFAKSANFGGVLMNLAAKMKLEAERRLGQVLTMMHIRPGGDQKSRKREKLLLKDIGFNYNRSSRSQRLAAFTVQQWSDFLSESRESGRELTTASAMRCINLISSSRTRRASKTKPRSKGSSFVIDRAAAPLHRHNSEQNSHRISSIEKMNEVRLHFRMVRQLLEPLCVTGTITLSTASQRVLGRYFTEIDHLLAPDLHT